MKRIYITESQLVNVFKQLCEDNNDKINIQMPDNLSELNPTEKRQTVDKLKQVARTDSRVELTVPVDPNKADVNKISGIIKEEGEGLDLISQVSDFIINNWGDELEDPHITTETIKDMIQDAYIEVTGMELQDEWLFHPIMKDLHKKVYSESVVLTKKQIKEMKANKKLAESVKIVTKKNLLNSLK